jgi:hypothetical protein
MGLVKSCPFCREFRLGSNQVSIMIYVDFNLTNPWSRRWRSVWCRYGRTPFPNKLWELQLAQTSHIIGGRVNVYGGDHAGLQLSVALLGYWLNFNFYDQRHLGE